MIVKAKEGIRLCSVAARSAGCSSGLDKAALGLLAEEGYDPVNGVCLLKRMFKYQIVDPRCLQIIRAEVCDGDFGLDDTERDVLTLAVTEPGGLK